MAFTIIRDDITNVSADAIVNTANPKPVFGAGTDAAIYKKAGVKELLKERKKIGKMEVGEAKATPAFSLNAEYIIHTVGPVYKDGRSGEEEDLRKCYKNCLLLAEELKCESVAFPLISTGSYGFPKAEALRIMISEFSDFLSCHEMEITLVVFDEESFAVSGKIFSGIDEYIDENYVSEKLDEEYSETETLLYREAVNKDRGNARVSDARERKNGKAAKHAGAGSASFLFPGSGRRAARDSSEPAFYHSGTEDEDVCDECVCAEEAVFDGAMEEEPCEPVCAASPAPVSKMLEMPAVAKPKERTLDELVNQVKETWQENLFRLIDEKGYTDTEVYKRANVDRKLFSKIRSNPSYQPKKSTAIAFALAMKLNLDETKDFLARAGYALSPSSKADLIVEYFIDNEEFDIYTINLALFDHEQPLLGA